MSNITLPNIFAANTLAASSQVNANFSTIVNDYNGNVNNSNLAANANITPTKLTGMATINGFRLSSSNASALPGDSASVSTIYLYPFTGSQIALNDGSGHFNVYDLGATIPSLALSGLTTNNVYSVYCYNSGTLVSPTFTLVTIVWGGINTPDSQTIIDGVITSSSNNLYRYVGAIYATGATTTSDTGAGGQRYIANASNLVYRFCGANSDTWNATTNSMVTTNTSNGTGRVTFLTALNNLAVSFQNNAFGSNSSATNGILNEFGLGLNSTTTATWGAIGITASSFGACTTNFGATFSATNGVNFLQRMVATTAATFSQNTSTPLSAPALQNLTAFVPV